MDGIDVGLFGMVNNRPLAMLLEYAQTLGYTAILFGCGKKEQMYNKVSNLSF